MSKGLIVQELKSRNAHSFIVVSFGYQLEDLTCFLYFSFSYFIF